MKFDLKPELYANLTGEMGRYGLTKPDVAVGTKIKYNTLRDKLDGKTDWTRGEMMKIRDTYFPEASIDDLFKRFE
jgi:hypothetical protein